MLAADRNAATTPLCPQTSRNRQQSKRRRLYKTSGIQLKLPTTSLTHREKLLFVMFVFWPRRKPNIVVVQKHIFIINIIIFVFLYSLKQIPTKIIRIFRYGYYLNYYVMDIIHRYSLDRSTEFLTCRFQITDFLNGFAFD